jgi:hypothetical protein
LSAVRDYRDFRGTRQDGAKQAQKEGLAAPFTLDEWNVEAGPQYFDETATAVEKAIQQATTTVKDRRPEPYTQSK